MLNERMKSLRQLHQLNQDEVGEILHISRSTYGMYENGKRQMPYNMLVQLADHYRVSLDYLFGRTDSPERMSANNETERQLLRQFRVLDKRGKDAISAQLRYEYSRTAKNNASSP